MCIRYGKEHHYITGGIQVTSCDAFLTNSTLVGNH